LRSAPYVRLKDRHTRYHGSVAGCLEAATVEALRRGPSGILLGYYHTVGCGPTDKMFCQGGCFTHSESTAQGAA
jgi:hypothetical protein